LWTQINAEFCDCFNHCLGFLFSGAFAFAVASRAGFEAVLVVTALRVVYLFFVCETRRRRK